MCLIFKNNREMTSPFDYRRDVEIPDDLIARLCAGEIQEKVSTVINSNNIEC